MAKKQLMEQIHRELKMYGNYLEYLTKKQTAKKGRKQKSGKN